MSAARASIERGLDTVRVLRYATGIQQRSRWSRDRIEEFQQRKLRAIFRHAWQHTPYYRDILDPEGKTRLEDVPTLDKPALIANFDRLVTDRQLRFAELYAASDRAAASNEPVYHLDKYAILTTGGTSGLRLFWPRDRASAALHCGVRVGRVFRVHDKKHVRPRLAVVGGPDNRHGSAFMNRFMPKFFAATTAIPASSDIEGIMRKLEAFRPTILHIFPSVALRLAPLASRLRPNLAVITCVGENLTDHVRDQLAVAYGCPVRSFWAAIEAGQIAQECSAGRMHVNEDVMILEVTDRKGRPLPPGEVGNAQITHLWNKTITVFRYRFDDQVQIGQGECPCGSAYRWLAMLEGRGSSEWVLPGAKETTVDVNAWRIIQYLIKNKEILGAQALLRKGDAPSIKVNVVVADARSGANPILATAKSIVEKVLGDQHVDLGRVGVEIVRVDELERLAQSGKTWSIRSVNLDQASA